jgi:alpha-2,3 sialyltransferase
MTRENLQNVLTAGSYTRLAPILDKVDQPLVIAGSGPSLQRINYKRFPKNFLTFRINNFFLEAKYYLGRNVDLCYQSMPRDETIYTLANVITDYEYNFNTDLIFTRERVTERFPDRYLFPRVEVENILSLDNKMYSYILEIFHYQEKHVTSGILSLLASIVLGFKDIYMIGVDFYSDKEKRYGYKVGENYRKTVEEQDLLPGYSEEFHSREIDLKGLDIALSYKDVHIRSICDDAFINQFIDLAPENMGKGYEIEDKANGAINDFIIPPNISGKEGFLEKTGIQKDLEDLKKTALVKFIWGFIIKPIFVIPTRVAVKTVKSLFGK